MDPYGRLQLYPDLEIPNKTPGQAMSDFFDGLQGIVGGVVRTPYATAKGIDDVVDIVKGQDMDDDTVIPRALKFLDDAANFITPDSETGKFGDEWIGQTIGPGGVIALASKKARKLPVLAAAAQANLAPIAGQVVEDMGGDATDRLMAEIAVGGAPTNFGNHRNRTDVTIGKYGVSKEAERAIEEAEGIYRDTGGFNYGHGAINKKRADKLREEVRRDTGAYVAPDGLGRLEIFDDYYNPGGDFYELNGDSYLNFGYNPLDLLKTDDARLKLSEVPGMQRIIDTVPMLDQVKIRRQGGIGGSYSRDDKEIAIGSGLARNGMFAGQDNAPALQVLGHELEHAIQHMTRTPRGGNYELGSYYGKTNLGRFSSAVKDGYFKRGNKKVNIAGGESLSDPDYGSNRLFLGMLDDMTTHYSKGNEHDRYLKIAGEGEARQAMVRAGMTPEQRVKTRPSYPRMFDYVFGTGGRSINPRNMTVRLDDIENTMGIRLPRYIVSETGNRMAPVPDQHLTRGRLGITNALPDQASVTLGFLYDQGLID